MPAFYVSHVLYKVAVHFKRSNFGPKNPWQEAKQLYTQPWLKAKQSYVQCLSLKIFIKREKLKAVIFVSKTTSLS